MTKQSLITDYMTPVMTKQSLITDYMTESITPAHTFRLGKVRGTNYAKGTPIHDRIIVDDQLLIATKPNGHREAWTTLCPLQISREECVFIGINNKPVVFMKRGVFQKGFFLDTITS